MNINLHKLPRSRHGFTLLEIIIVIALIALIVTAVVPNLDVIFRDNQEKVAKTEVLNLETPLFAYKLKNGSYPSTEEGLAAVVESGELKKLPEDPWKRAYNYKFPGEKNKGSYDLWSSGADGVESDDDIGNWDAK